MVRYSIMVNCENLIMFMFRRKGKRWLTIDYREYSDSTIENYGLSIFVIEQ